MNVHRVILFGQYQYQDEVSLHPSIIEMPVTIIAVGKFIAYDISSSPMSA